MKKFADHLGMQGAAASLLVSGMVRTRLLKRVVDSKNRRYVRISLSGKGEKVLQAVMPQMECVSEERFPVCPRRSARPSVGSQENCMDSVSRKKKRPGR